MKVTIELSDNQIAEFLQESVRVCMRSAIPRNSPMKDHEVKDLMDAITTAMALNVVIEYLGGDPVDLTRFNL